MSFFSASSNRRRAWAIHCRWIIHYITTQNKTTKETTTYFWDANEGAEEFSVSGLNGGTGVAFPSEDFAAFSWALENSSYTGPKAVEHAGAIYSQNNRNGRTYSYNGSYPGSHSKSNYNERNIPSGSRLEGFIHTHPTDIGFSKHIDPTDVNQTLDEDFMDLPENQDKDFYLVNPNGDFEVSRRGELRSSNGSRGDDSILATGLNTGYIRVNSNAWLGPDGSSIRQSDLPAILQLLKPYMHKH